MLQSVITFSAVLIFTMVIRLPQALCQVTDRPISPFPSLLAGHLCYILTQFPHEEAMPFAKWPFTFLPPLTARLPITSLCSSRLQPKLNILSVITKHKYCKNHLVQNNWISPLRIAIIAFLMFSISQVTKDIFPHIVSYLFPLRRLFVKAGGNWVI